MAAATTASSSCWAAGRRPASASGSASTGCSSRWRRQGSRARRRRPSPVAVVVGADPDDTVARLAIATELRAAGMRPAPTSARRKLGKQLEAAARDGAHFAVIVGDELAAGEVQLRDLRAGTAEGRAARRSRHEVARADARPPARHTGGQDGCRSRPATRRATLTDHDGSTGPTGTGSATSTSRSTAPISPNTMATPGGPPRSRRRSSTSWATSRGKDVLEFGCGAAQWSIALAKRGARPVGLDLSDRQLEHARRLMAEAGVDFPLVHASAESVPLPDASFDIVFCDHGAMTFADPYRTVPEAARLLRPGGLFAFNHGSTIADLRLAGRRGAHGRPTAALPIACPAAPGTTPSTRTRPTRSRPTAKSSSADRRVQALDLGEDLVGDRLLLIARRLGDPLQAHRLAVLHRDAAGTAGASSCAPPASRGSPTGTIGAPVSSASRPIPGFAVLGELAGARAPALAVHRDRAAAAEDRVGGLNASSSRWPRRTGKTPPCV